MQAILADFVECFRHNGTMAQWLQYLINKVLCSESIPLWQKIHNSETIRIGKLSALVSRPSSFGEPVLGDLHPNSSSTFWKILP
jgi:hypothetical protein